MRARSLTLLILAPILLSSFRCSLPWQRPDSSEILIASYNAHNLFDDVDDGGEYPEFSVASGRWNEGLYRKRLENAAAAIASFSPEGGRLPDIVCLEEIEGEKVLRDLAAGPLKAGGYRWIACGGPAASAIKCGILSRLPISEVRSHALEDAWGFGPARDMLEAGFALGEGEPRLTVFVCHWKSRREGPAVTEPARRAASALAAARIAEAAEADPGACFVVCGDFNESPDEFARAKGLYATALMPVPGDGAPVLGEDIPAAWEEGVLKVALNPRSADCGAGGVALYSPWATSDGFSYVFDGEKDRLDGFLLGPALVNGEGLEFSRFAVSGDEKLLDSEGEPSAWNGNSGYSDHLPILLVLDR
jgi:endonuclease/exonuclease/phosphatase family metal-dependent hydrolase